MLLFRRDSLPSPLDKADAVLDAYCTQRVSVDFAGCPLKEMGWDPVNVNVNGEAIALSHPMGASGRRLR
jgi:hypothetical protein